MSERDGRKRAAGRKRGSREGGVIPVFSYVVPQSRRVAVRGEEKTKKKIEVPSDLKRETAFRNTCRRDPRGFKQELL